MEQIKVIDLETTGLQSNSEIAQLAIVSLDGNLNPVSFKDMYFNIHEEMPEEARKVNGLTKTFLEIESGGTFFIDVADKVAEELSGCTLVAHNYAFEKKMLKYWLNGKLDDSKWICTMLRYTPTLGLKDYAGNGGYKYCNLRELTSYIRNVVGISADELTVRYESFTGKKSKFHDALFDTYVTALALSVLG